jgi:hypothetical protein
MNYEQHVRRASGGDVKAFVDLTRQFQHMAFGAAFALVNDFRQAECCAKGALRPRVKTGHRWPAAASRPESVAGSARQQERAGIKTCTAAVAPDGLSPPKVHMDVLS